MNLQEWKQLCHKAWGNEYDYLRKDRIAKIRRRDTLSEFVKQSLILNAPLNEHFFRFHDCQRLYSIKNRQNFQKFGSIILLEKKIQLKALGLQDKLRKQNFLEHMKKVFEPTTDTVKQTAQETIGVVEGPTTSNWNKRRRIEKKTINEVEDLKKYVVNFDLRMVEPLSDVIYFENTSRFPSRVSPISKNFK